MKDFMEASELLTPEGPLKGLNAIRSFFEEIFKIVPKGSALEMKQMIIRDNIACKHTSWHRYLHYGKRQDIVSNPGCSNYSETIISVATFCG
jgi:hypothetical protein